MTKQTVDGIEYHVVPSGDCEEHGVDCAFLEIRIGCVAMHCGFPHTRAILLTDEAHKVWQINSVTARLTK